jgi:hypothetical protein
MTCLETLIGLQGGCADISTAANTYLNTKVTYSELSSYVDQNDYPSVDDLFIALRSQAVREVIDSITAHMKDGFVAKTVVSTQTIGYAGTSLATSAALAKYKGVKLWRKYPMPFLAYRVTSVGFIGNYTGNLTVLFVDGITGVTLGTQVVSAVAGQEVSVDVNELYRVEKLLILYNASAITAYKTTPTTSGQTCYTCPTSCSINAHVTAQAITATIGAPLTQSTLSDMGGLILSVSMECDAEGWMCQYRQQLAMPILFKVAELVMEYALYNTSRGNTNTVRDYEKLGARQSMYRDNFNTAMDRVFNTVNLPNDPICFNCRRGIQIRTTLP